MTSGVPDLIVAPLRTIRNDIAGTRTTLADHGTRLRAIEIGEIRERRDRADDAETAVRLPAKVDRPTTGVSRTERRLGIVD